MTTMMKPRQDLKPVLVTGPGRPPASNLQQPEPNEGFWVAVPQSLILNPHVSAAALKLYCLLMTLERGHADPELAVLRASMGTVDASGTQRPVTERSIHRWLNELVAAGWLQWNQRAPLHQRYILRAPQMNRDRPAQRLQLNNSEDNRSTSEHIGQAHQAQRELAGECPVHGRPAATPGVCTGETEHGEDDDPTLVSDDATSESDRTSYRHSRCPLSELGAPHTANDPTLESDHATPESDSSASCAARHTSHATQGSDHATLVSDLTIQESDHATPESHDSVIYGITKGYNESPKDQISESQNPESPSSPCLRTGDDDGETLFDFLIDNGMGVKAATEFRHFPRDVAIQEFNKFRTQGKDTGHIVNLWRVRPPQAGHTVEAFHMSMSRRSAQVLAWGAENGQDQPNALASVLDTREPSQLDRDPNLDDEASERNALGEPPSPTIIPTDPADIWRLTLAALQESVVPRDYARMFQRTRLLSVDERVAFIGAPDRVTQQELEDRLVGPLRRALGNVLHRPVQIRILIAKAGGC